MDDAVQRSGLIPNKVLAETARRSSRYSAKIQVSETRLRRRSTPVSRPSIRVRVFVLQVIECVTDLIFGVTTLNVEANYFGIVQNPISPLAASIVATIDHMGRIIARRNIDPYVSISGLTGWYFARPHDERRVDSVYGDLFNPFHDLVQVYRSRMKGAGFFVFPHTDQ